MRKFYKINIVSNKSLAVGKKQSKGKTEIKIFNNKIVRNIKHLFLRKTDFIFYFNEGLQNLLHIIQTQITVRIM